MKMVKAVKNQYLGINAHLHSYWQTQGGWKEFHTSYIVYLTAALKAKLLPMGYTAGIESSLQIRRLDRPDSEPEADVAIFDPDPDRPFLQREPYTPGATANVIDLAEVLEYEEEPSEYRAIAIYEAEAGGEYGEPVAWIEVLSPSNKPGGSHAREYRLKRRKLLDSAIVFVELDYLHESSPTFDKIPRYRPKIRTTQLVNSGHPYHILVIDPRPMISSGKVHVYQFDVDVPLPSVLIPLNANDILTFDFGIAYHRTLAEEFFAYERVDYTQFPVNFDRYSKDDQERIAARMIAVLEAAKQGIDLETGPFPTQPIALEEALVRIETLQQG